MKKNAKWILTAAALVALLLLAVLLYRHLSERYVPSAPSSPASSAASDADASAPEQTQADPSAARAADFTVYDADENPVRLSEHFGKPLVVNFWATWCGPCCLELPSFNVFASSYADNIDFMMVNLDGITPDARADVQAFLQENGYTFPVYYDLTEEASAVYGAYSIPLTVFIRADGTVLESYLGAMPPGVLQAYLDRLVNG